MLERFEIRGDHAIIDDNLKKYVTKKIGRIDRFLPKTHRDSMHAEVCLKEARLRERKQSTCDVTLHLPHETIKIKETTMNMYAAIDIVEAKLKQRIKRYKDLHGSGKSRRRMFARLRRKTAAAA